MRTHSDKYVRDVTICLLSQEFYRRRSDPRFSTRIFSLLTHPETLSFVMALAVNTRYDGDEIERQHIQINELVEPLIESGILRLDTNHLFTIGNVPNIKEQADEILNCLVTYQG